MALLQGVKILVIEDEPDVLAAYVMLLRLEGAEVRGAGSGREALALSRECHFNVVVSDLGLPDIPGDVLIRTIRASGSHRLPVLVITGEGEPFVVRASEAGADVIFTKPVVWGRVLSYLGGLGLEAAA